MMVQLSLSQHERPSEHRDEQQSIFERSVIEDRVLHEMVEQQKAGSAKQQMHGKQFLPDSPVASSPMAVLPLYERDITECTALSALTEAASDDDTHPAGYMGNPTDLARSLTDNQLAKFLEIMQQEADARQTVIDNRRSMRRSRSGGNESAFVSAGRRPMSKPLCLDQEDEELSGFAASEPILVSRSGAHQPSPHGSPDLSPSSRPASRLSGLVHLQALLPAPCSVPVPIARRPKRQTIEDRLGDMALDDDLSSVVSRELLLSPFSAFDDISVGSQSQSITSSRSSKTRRYALDASPPAVTSKQLHRGAGKPKTSRLVQAGVKKQ